ncbi:MAG TPA: hypothetical protein VHY34_01985 [Caulobacteraceae bacterium]|jgi:hypothetical protein|nr:hypothetical protein [Caulobacteraceae bacterium]
MRHARDEALDGLEPLLARLRRIDGLWEKKRGIFYRGSRAFLHFHEDPAGLFADIRRADGRDFDRVQLDDADAREALVKAAAERATS